MKPNPIPPKPGQESVWDYPRPPRWEDTDKQIRIIFQGIVLAQTNRSKRVLETSHPPLYYIPCEDIQLEYLRETPQRSFCEWKGWCQYYDVCVGDKLVRHAAWRYVQLTPDFVVLQDHYSFYANLMDACYVDSQLVTPQPGDFYGGWITPDIVGSI